MDKEKQLQTDREESRQDESGDTIVLEGNEVGSAIVTGRDIYIQHSRALSG
jgi:hypothetical protein